MKNYIAVAALFAAGTAFANAAYVWTGAVDSSWNNQGNWDRTDGSTWNSAGGTGPGTTGSNMWDEIKFDGTQYTTAPTAPASLEGWNVKLKLVNGANVTFNSFGKWQTQGQSYIYVDATSSLTISAADNFGYRGDAASFDIASYEGLKLTRSVWSNANPSPAFNINLHEQGSVKAAWSLSGDISIVFTADLAYSTTNAGQYTIAGTSDDGQYRLVQRTLWVNEHDNGGLIDSDGHVFTLNGDTLEKSTDALTASADSLGKYCLEKIDTVGGGKNIVVSYVEAIPEPSAFGLLAGLGALALVASRRRRK